MSLSLFLIMSVVLPILLLASLYVFRKSVVSPWFWVPAFGWSGWMIFSLTPIFFPKDPFHGPPDWGILGLGFTIAAIQLTASSLTLMGSLVFFPKRFTHSPQPWLGGLLVALLCPAAGWWIVTDSLSLRLIDPQGNPVPNATVYRLRAPWGNRLASAERLASDAEGNVSYRTYPRTEESLFVSGGSEWANTVISISFPSDGIRPPNPIDTREVRLSWGQHANHTFENILRDEWQSSWNQHDRASGRSGWIVESRNVGESIPIYLHSSKHPVNPELLSLLRKQFGDANLTSSFPSMVSENCYGGYGFALGNEIRRAHALTGDSNPRYESHLRHAMLRQAEGIEMIRKQMEIALGKKGDACDQAIKYLDPWLTWFGLNQQDVDLESKLRDLDKKVQENAIPIRHHIRNHPSTTPRSLREFESCLSPSIDDNRSYR